jgi:hypothetical protein
MYVLISFDTKSSQYDDNSRRSSDENLVVTVDQVKSNTYPAHQEQQSRYRNQPQNLGPNNNNNAYQQQPHHHNHNQHQSSSHHHHHHDKKIDSGRRRRYSETSTTNSFSSSSSQSDSSATYVPEQEPSKNKIEMNKIRTKKVNNSEREQALNKIRNNGGFAYARQEAFDYKLPRPTLEGYLFFFYQF